MLERDHLQGVNVDARKLLSWTFKKKYVKFCIVLSRLIQISANAPATLWL
jgi:hypothetical protein